MSRATIFLCHQCYDYIDNDEDLLAIYSYVVKDFVADGVCKRASLEQDSWAHPYAELEQKGYIISTECDHDRIIIRPLSCKHIDSIFPDTLI